MIPTGYDAEWAPQQFWTLRRRCFSSYPLEKDPIHSFGGEKMAHRAGLTLWNEILILLQFRSNSKSPFPREFVEDFNKTLI
jgi:hypothetical protein